MLSAAICEKYALKYHIWDEPSATKITCNNVEHNGYIQVVKNHQKQNQQAAKQLNTQQFQEHKAVIQVVRTKQQAERKIIRVLSIQQIFKKKQYPQLPQRKKGIKGIDYIRYMNQFQVFILYEFAKEVQRNHPEKKI